ncbi:MAG: transcriptional repressor LexA [Gammaproteobacteria bacterium]
MPKTRAGETRAKVLNFVCRRILSGEPPSIREVSDEFGFRSTATAREHLDALVDAGELTQNPGKDRGYRIPGAFIPAMIPILGKVHAGGLHEAIESAAGYVPVDPKTAATSFALTVSGESMAGREIHDGDVIVVQTDVRIKNGDVVVALIGEEATVKTFHKHRNRIILKAENPHYEDIVPDSTTGEFSIVGRVIEVRRQL